MIKRILLISFITVAFISNAQSLRHKTVSVSSDSIYLDSMPVMKESISIFNEGKLLSEGFRFIPGKNILVVDTTLIHGKLNIYYRVVQVNYKPSYAHKSPSMIEPSFDVQPSRYYNYSDPQNTSLIFSNSGLDINGNIARGLGFGNNQDVVVNSNLNLQMSGKLGKGIGVLAVISDENNPIQPAGNTQQIQDFDKVFITLQKDSNALTVGDVLMTSPRENYFLKYYKKSRGLQIDYRTGRAVNYHLHMDGAVSRGRFVRNEIQGVEGNQGPYRLQGANNELNIIVISGTEAVYVDGEKLSRGQQNDYTIDYNTGAVTFMPKRLISKFSRIIVEFQYSDRNYARSVFVAGNEFRTNQWFHSVQYFSEQDNKQQPTDTSNKSSIQNILEASGDQRALYQNVRKFVTYQSDRVMYKKIDSLGYSIFVHVSDTDIVDTFYSVSFSYTGSGGGSYISIASSANGKVFEWVAPVNGQLMGSYVPYIEVVPPNRMQMLTASSTYRKDDKTSLKIEGVYTNYNQNTLSSLDKANDDGFGLHLDFNQKHLKKGDFDFTNEVKVEMVDKNFKRVERYRSVEFERTWKTQLANTGSQQPGFDEIISNLKTTIVYREKTRLQLLGGNYIKGSVFDGYRGLADFSHTTAKFQVNAGGEYLNTISTQNVIRETNVYYKYRGGVNQYFKYFKVGVDGSKEESRFNEDTSANLNKASFSYNQISGFLQSTETLGWKYRLDGNIRSDYSPDKEEFIRSSVGYNATGNIENVDKKGNRLMITANYRKLKTVNQAFPDETFLNRIEYGANFFKRIIITSAYYEIGTGRVQKSQYSFSQVQPGQGTYAWIDYNNNGVEELNEFQVATYKDQAKYVKIYLPTNEFIKSNSNEFNQTIRLQAPAQWQSSPGIRKFLARINSVTAYMADRKITDNRFPVVVNPFFLNVADSSLISVNSLIKQTTFFNRTSPKFGLEHTIQTNRSKSTLNTGFEWGRTDRQNLTIRYAFTKNVNMVTALEMKDKQNTNEYFTSNNYHYLSQSIFPELFYQTVNGFRMGVFYNYLESFNSVDLGGEKAYITQYGAELRYFVVNKGNVDAKITSYDINFLGNTNTPMAYDLMGGLSNGKNLTWTVSFGGKAAGNIQLNLSYEGRKAQETKPIHIGRAEARYIF